MNSLTTGETSQATPTEKIAGDRRTDRRYDIVMNVRWKLIRRKRVLEAGMGITVDLSSGGILFETDRQLPVGMNVELSIAWPVRLHNSAPLQLVVSGKVVRTVGQRTAIRMIQHEFRTAGLAVNSKEALSAGAGSMSKLVSRLGKLQ